MSTLRSRATGLALAVASAALVLSAPVAAHAATTLSATAETDGSHRARVSWEFTTDECLYDGAKVFRSEAGYAASVLGGPGQTQIDYLPLRSSAFSAAESYTSGDAFVDPAVQNGVTYYYTVFVKTIAYTTLAEGWAGPATAQVRPSVRAVDGADVTSGDHQLEVTWGDPYGEPDLASTRVLYSTTGFAASPEVTGDQHLAWEGGPGAAGSHNVVMSGLVNERTHYLTWFTRSGDGVWSTPCTATGTPTEYQGWNDEEGDPGPERLTQIGYYDNGRAQNESRVFRVALVPGQTFVALLAPTEDWQHPLITVKPTRREVVLFGPAAAFSGAATPVARATGKAFPASFSSPRYYPAVLSYLVPPGGGGDYYVAVRRKYPAASDNQIWALYWARHSGSGAFRIRYSRVWIWTHPQDRKKRLLHIQGSIEPTAVAAGALGDRGDTSVLLQRKSKGKWVTEDWFSIDDDGTFHAYLRLSRSRKPITWRLYMPAYGGCSSATTAARTTR
jgi:hypothetical protein